MKIFIMRHGEASLEASSDAARPLTARGVKQCNSIGQFLQREATRLDYALVSPYLRAKQTLAEVAKHALPAEIEEINALTPGGDTEIVIDTIAELAAQGIENLLIVSHLPLVGYLVAELCPGVPPPMFSTGSVAMILLDEKTRQGSLHSIVAADC